MQHGKIFLFVNTLGNIKCRMHFYYFRVVGRWIKVKECFKWFYFTMMYLKFRIKNSKENALTERNISIFGKELLQHGI
jgi:hypothetical protein